VHLLILGAGGVGGSACAIVRRRRFTDRVVVADYSAERARAVVDRYGDERFTAAQVDAGDEQAIGELITAFGIDTVLNAVDPRFVMPIFRAALAAGTTYLDMAMSLSHPHPEQPYTETGVKLGDEQFALAGEWEQRGQLALVGMSVEPGLADVFARHASDTLFSRIDEVGVRDGADLEVAGFTFAPTFNIWTTIEECLNPPVIYERERGWFTTPPFSEPETFVFPAGIGAVECVNVEHEEVVLVPRWVDTGRVTFKYGLGDEFIEVLEVLHKTGLDSTAPIEVGTTTVSPRDVVAACLPDPVTLGDRMTGKTCAGTWVRGLGPDGARREVYLYHVVDNEQTMADYGCQAVVWQTAICPVVALELLDAGVWAGAGVLGPEALPAAPFLDLLGEYGSPHGIDERVPGS
jgi:saccharopine dehydrogenase (NAD+, L-lysine forming)